MAYTILYANFLKRFLNPQGKLKVVFDCSNGVTGIILKELFLKPNTKHQTPKILSILINNKPDGHFPAHGPNPLLRGAKKQLESVVLKKKADLGIIFDADGDRVFFVDNKGRPVDTDIIVYLLAPHFKPPYMVDTAEGALPIHWLDPHLKIIETKTGHYFIKKAMRAKKINFAAEHSGHYYFKNFFFADSGILAAILVINQVSKLKARGSNFDGWINSLPKHYEAHEQNFRIKNKERALQKATLYFKKQGCKTKKRDGLTAIGRDFWVNLRVSKTEPLLRLNIEAKDKQILVKKKREILRLLK